MTVGAVGGVGSQVAPASSTQGQSAPKEASSVGQAESTPHDRDWETKPPY